jgi:hypothetical protein
VVEAGGVLLAHAGFTLREAVGSGTTFRVACFGSVFSVPGHEGQGHATAALAQAITQARAAGADLGLVSGARGLYARAGFQPYPACRRWRVPRSAPAGDITVAPFAPGALPTLMALQETEPVRFVRPLADWQRLLSAGVLFYDPARIFMVERRGRAVAYAAIARRGEDGAHRALELGGERAAIAAAVPAILEALGVETMDIIAPEHDHALAGVAAHLGWRGEEARFPFGGVCWTPARAGSPWPWYGFNYV